jgi:hypothetical protein
MNLTECIQITRKAHELLRSRTGGTRPDEQSSTAYQTVKKGLAELWAAAQERPEKKQMCSNLYATALLQRGVGKHSIRPRLTLLSSPKGDSP